jgi:two-component system chemotaxis response regulator CheY
VNVAKTILVIDDSKSSRLAARLVLLKAGFNVIEAEDGMAGLAMLDGREVNLVICDVNMPVMGGIEFVHAVKELSHYKFLPILMLTTESLEATKSKGRDAGAKAWMLKPFKPTQLVSAAQKLCT